MQREEIITQTAGSRIFESRDSIVKTQSFVRPLRIAFFIDGKKESYGKIDGVAVTYDFACALSQNALDVAIVSDYILKNLILRKYTKNPDPILAKIHLTLNNWDIYQVKNTQFFVFVPHNYDDNTILNKKNWTKIDLSIGDEYNGSGVDCFPIISWAKNTPVEVKRLLSNKNLKYIPYAKNLNTEIAPPNPTQKIILQQKFDPLQLSLIFDPGAKIIKTEAESELSTQKSCNIYISGHGKRKKVAGIDVNDMTNTLFFFNEKLNTKSVRIVTCSAGGKNLDLMQLKSDIPIRIEYLLIVDSITDAPTALNFMSKKVTTRRLKKYFEALENFQNGDQFFIEKLNELRARKIGAGDEDIRKIKSEIKKLERNSGLDEVLKNLSLPKQWYLDFCGPNNFPQIWIPKVGWFQTFETDQFIQKITDASIIKTSAKPKTKIVKVDTKTEISKDLTTLEHLDFDLHSTIEINEKLALLLYSEIVSDNLNITPIYIDISANKLPEWLFNLYKFFPSIPCLDSIHSNALDVIKNFYIYPQIISMQHEDSINLFAKINLPNVGNPTQNGILNFLRDSFLVLRGRKSSKTFFIKELEGFNDFSEILDENDNLKRFLSVKQQEKRELILQNVIIETKMDGDLTHINLSFDFKGKTWILIYSPMDINPQATVKLANKSQSIWHFKKCRKGPRKKNLRLLHLTYLANLTTTKYHAQLPVIRDLFKRQNTKSLKNFITSLNLKEITSLVKKSPDITSSEWKRFEKQTQLKLQRKKTQKSMR
jgi:hypothetical protein